jgi:pimeloyl-ACP methyl ester carboxylesterase
MLGLAVLAVAAGVTWQLLGCVADARRCPPPGRLIDIGNGQRLHLHSLGTGTPTVILEAGIAASSLSWTHVQPRVAEFARTCSYDRAGLAWSTAARGPITAAGCARELDAMLQVAAIPPPYVLVGHSYGAFVLYAYAARHPHNVDGLVLVDPIYPSEWLTMTRRERWRLTGGAFLSRVGAALSAVGVVRACLALLARGSTGVPRRVSHLFGSEAAKVLDRLVGEVQKLPAETWPAVQTHWSQAKCFSSMAKHLDGLRKSAAEVEACGELPRDIPVVVLTAASQPAAYREEHARMAARSARGRQIVATGSGHWIHLDEPELVVDAIRTVVGDRRAAPRPA